MTEILTIKCLRGKTVRPKGSQEKAELRMNTVSGELVGVTEFHWGNWTVLQVPSEFLSSSVPHAHMRVIGSGALVHSPRFSSSIFFQSVSLLLSTTLLRIRNIIKMQLFKFYPGFFFKGVNIQAMSSH